MPRFRTIQYFKECLMCTCVFQIEFFAYHLPIAHHPPPSAPFPLRPASGSPPSFICHPPLLSVPCPLPPFPALLLQHLALHHLTLAMYDSPLPPRLPPADSESRETGIVLGSRRDSANTQRNYELHRRYGNTVAIIHNIFIDAFTAGRISTRSVLVCLLAQLI